MFNKVTYSDNSTTIHAANLNDIQNEVIRTCSYAVCQTAPETAAKTATWSYGGGFVLALGARITVRFTEGNTAANPTLNIAGSGAKPITIKTGAAAGSGAWLAGEILELVYDGTYWQIVGRPGNAVQLSYTKSENIIQMTDTAGNVYPQIADSEVTTAKLYGYQQKTISTATNTFTLEAGVYLCVVTRTNSSSTAQSGLYVIQSYPTGASSICSIVSSSVATLSISGSTLTVTTTSNYTAVRLIKI